MNKDSTTKYMIVMRHGDQCPRNGLTEKGKEQVKTTAQVLEAQGLIPDVLITSYSDRAKLSASILSAHFNVAVSRTTELLNVFDSSFNIETFYSPCRKSQKSSPFQVMMKPCNVLVIIF